MIRRLADDSSFFFTLIAEVIQAMSLKYKTDALFRAAGSQDTTPQDMKSMIVELENDREFAGTGDLRAALQGALHIALMPGNDDDSEQKLGVIMVIAETVAADCGKEYVRDVMKAAVARGTPESLINKILEEWRN